MQQDGGDLRGRLHAHRYSQDTQQADDLLVRVQVSRMKSLGTAGASSG